MKRPTLPHLNKTWIVLTVALAIGLVAALTTRSFLHTQVAEIEARNRHETTDVVVAKTDLAPNTVLDADNVAVRKVPLEYAHSGAVQPGDFERISGRPIAYQVKQGEMILWSQMTGKRAPTFSARVAQGQRAITVMVDEINSISGMLEPGDYIDLIFTVDQNGKKTALPLLQSVQVMATGQRSVDDPRSGERTQFATVTLDATPEQARGIVIARETGKLTALLRNPDDKQAVSGKRFDLSGLLGLQPDMRPAAVAAAAPRREIPVLYGGSGARNPPEALHLPRAASGRASATALAAPAEPPPSAPPTAPATPPPETPP